MNFFALSKISTLKNDFNEGSTAGMQNVKSWHGNCDDAKTDVMKTLTNLKRALHGDK